MVQHLPSGQSPAPLLRFGLPRFARVQPEVPDRPSLTIGGLVRRPTQLDVAELLKLAPFRHQLSDLHCVTTWSAQGLTWSGVDFRHVHEHLLTRVEPHPEARWIVFRGLDGYSSCLRLDDALATDVMLVSALDGHPLTPEQGAPLRLVAPAHYGYKSVKHLCAIEYRVRYDPGPARWAGHPRGRVAREERSRLLPGWLWRRIWRRLLPRVRRLYLP